MTNLTVQPALADADEMCSPSGGWTLQRLEGGSPSAASGPANSGAAPAALGSPFRDVSNVPGPQRQLPPSAMLYRYKQQEGKPGVGNAAAAAAVGPSTGQQGVQVQGWGTLLSFLSGIAIDG